MSAVVRVATAGDQEQHVQGIGWFCPACREPHSIPLPRWQWNGDRERQTISPSVLHFNVGKDGQRITRCHYFIRDGRIEYCADSPHALAGQAVEMLPVERWPT